MTLLLVATMTGLVLSTTLIVLAAVAAASLITEPSLTEDASIVASFDQQPMDATTKAA